MGSPVSFASFNVYNFQEPGGRVFRSRVTQALYDAKRDWTREKIIQLDADVIVFQKLWARGCLEHTFSDPALRTYTLHTIALT